MAIAEPWTRPKVRRLRDLHREQDDEADDGECGDEAVQGGGLLKDFEHGVHSASASKGLSCRIGAGSARAGRALGAIDRPR